MFDHLQYLDTYEIKFYINDNWTILLRTKEGLNFVDHANQRVLSKIAPTLFLGVSPAGFKGEIKVCTHSLQFLMTPISIDLKH